MGTPKKLRKLFVGQLDYPTVRDFTNGPDPSEQRLTAAEAQIAARESASKPSPRTIEESMAWAQLVAGSVG